jgi:hypothetical protein
MKQLDKIYSSVEVKLELIKKSGYVGLDVVDAPGKPLEYRERAGKTVTALQIFDLADFCARNGANERLSALFDVGLRRDPELVTTVHETKAERMIDVFLYFLSIDSAADARKTFDILDQRYKDTRAYGKKIAGDAEIKEHMAMVIEGKRRSPQPLARAERRREPEKVPAPPPPPGKPETGETERGEEPPAPGDPTGAGLPEGTAVRVEDLVQKGDRYFDEAMKHLLNSKSDENPDGWAAENKTALELFLKANEQGYLPAQDIYGNGAVPQPLLDRVRETTMRASLCRKRAVRT